MSTLQEFGKASFQRDIAELKKAANFNSRRDGRGILVDGGNGCKHWILTQTLRDNSDKYNYNLWLSVITNYSWVSYLTSTKL